MITKKAAVGFILLALIVFPTAYYSWAPAKVPGSSTKIDLGDEKKWNRVYTGEIRTEYRAPIIAFDNPTDMAIAVTTTIELFTFICYILLKRIEPAINAFFESEKERVG